MREPPRIKVTQFRKSNFKHKMKRSHLPQKVALKKYRTRISRRQIIKNILPEKPKENM